MKKHSYKDALLSLKSIREGRAKNLDVLGSGDQDIIEEVDEERFIALKHARSVRDFIDRDIEDADDEDVFADDDDAGEIILPEHQKDSNDTEHHGTADFDQKDPAPFIGDIKKRKRENSIDIFSQELRSRKRRPISMRQTKSILEILKPKTTVEVEESKIFAAMEFEDAKDEADQPGPQLRRPCTQKPRVLSEPVVSNTLTDPGQDKSVAGSEEDPIDSPSQEELNTQCFVSLNNRDGSESTIQSLTPLSNEDTSAPNNALRLKVGEDEELPQETKQFIGNLIGSIEFEDQNFSHPNKAESTDLCPPLVTDDKENSSPTKGLFFYVIDAHEPQIGEKGYGSILLFGKAFDIRSRNSISACLVVQDVFRNVFLRPRNQPSNIDDEAECKGILKSMSEDLRKICEDIESSRIRVKCRRRKVVLKSQKEQKDGQLVLNQLELYFKLIYPATAKPLSDQLILSRCSAITHVFGCNRSLLEILMVKRHIMGPCWLSVKALTLAEMAETGCQSWCAAEFLCSSYKDIKTLSKDMVFAEKLPPTPTMTMVSLAIKGARQTNPNRSDQSDYKMISLDLIVNRDCDITKRNSSFRSMEKKSLLYIDHTTNLKNVRTAYKLVTSSLKEFVAHVISIVQKANPDIIIGHDLYGALIPLILNIICASGNTEWSRLSKLRRAPTKLPARWARLPAYSQGCLLFCGILSCDTLKLSQEILGPRVTYSLPALLTEQFEAPSIAWDKKIIDGEQLYSCIEIIRGDTKYKLEDYLCLSELCGAIRSKLSAQTNSTNPQYVLPAMENICYQSGAEEAAMLIKLAEKMSIFPLTQELAQLTGSLWDRSLFCQRAERNEYLLIHRFRSVKWIPPDPLKIHNAFGLKNDRKKENNEDDPSETEHPTTAAKGAAYEGGLVLDPLSGFYDTYILYLDFASLYPSIIQEFNLCFSTLTSSTDGEGSVDIIQSMKHENQDSLALLPSLLKDLVQKRKEVKCLMKKSAVRSHEYQLLEIKQKAIKLVANSIYGSLGYKNFRFYSPDIASRVTALGRHILLMTKNKVEKSFGCSVIYGDTDSIMVDSGLKDSGRNTRGYYDALEKAHKIAQEINKHHNKLELEVETIFKKLLLLTKKKYAALKVSDMVNRVFEKEVKGLDIVRRDWCGITKKLGHEILDFLFTDKTDGNESDDPALIASFVCDILNKVRTQMEQDETPLEDYVITKSLTKMPGAYANPKQIPHVALALDLQLKGRVMHQGLNISYVVCREAKIPNDVTLGARVYRPEDVRADLTIDKNWYKTTQILPPVIRLCQYVGGLPVIRLAEALGCDCKTRNSNVTTRDTNGDIWDDETNSSVPCNMMELMSWAQYGNGNAAPCKPPYALKCSTCAKETEIEVAIDERKCSTCRGIFSVVEICAQITTSVQSEYSRFTSFRTKCIACDHENFFSLFCQCGSNETELVITQSALERHLQWVIKKLDVLKQRKPEVVLLVEIIKRFHSDDYRCIGILKTITAENEAIETTMGFLQDLLPMESIDLLALVTELTSKIGLPLNIDGPKHLRLACILSHVESVMESMEYRPSDDYLVEYSGGIEEEPSGNPSESLYDAEFAFELPALQFCSETVHGALYQYPQPPGPGGYVVHDEDESRAPQCILNGDNANARIVEVMGTSEFRSHVPPLSNCRCDRERRSSFIKTDIACAGLSCLCFAASPLCWILALILFFAIIHFSGTD